MEEKVYLENKSGLKLASVVHRPVGIGPFPMVILQVGFTGYKEESRIELLATKLANMGIGAIRFDPSGFGESEGSIENDYRFSNYVSDSQAIFDYVTKLYWVDNSKIGICGQSMGGVQAMILAKNNISSVKALVLVSSPIIMGNDDDLSGKYKNWQRDGTMFRKNSRYGEFFVPFEFILDAKLWNGLEYLKDLSMPTLVIWCTNDLNVPPAVTKEIYEKAVGPKEFKIIEGADHFLNRDPSMVNQMIEYTVEFFSRIFMGE